MEVLALARPLPQKRFEVNVIIINSFFSKMAKPSTWKMILPNEGANAIVFLKSNPSIIGEIIHVDGGVRLISLPIQTFSLYFNQEIIHQINNRIMSTESQIHAALDELVQLVAAGKPMEAYEKFYHKNLEKTDLDGITHKGKAVNRAIGETLLSKVTAIRDFLVVGKIVKDNRSFLVWSLDFDHSENGPIKVTQVAIQDWEDGQIIRERFIA
ncbi:MAG: hypothetical protein AAGD05_09320 [Bacteroidota bacterium]